MTGHRQAVDEVGHVQLAYREAARQGLARAQQVGPAGGRYGKDGLALEAQRRLEDAQGVAKHGDRLVAPARGDLFLHALGQLLGF